MCVCFHVDSHRFGVAGGRTESSIVECEQGGRGGVNGVVEYRKEREDTPRGRDIC